MCVYRNIFTYKNLQICFGQIQSLVIDNFDVFYVHERQFKANKKLFNLKSMKPDNFFYRNRLDFDDITITYNKVQGTRC